MRFLRRTLLLALAGALSGVASLRADTGVAAVKAIVRGLQPLQKTEDVRLARSAGHTTEPLSLAAKLAPGDSMISDSEEIAVEINCPDGTLYRFQGKFYVVVIPPSQAGCAVNILSGRLHVLADHPTEVNAGGVRLGSDGTVYSVAVDPSHPDKQLRVAVFEGKIKTAGEDSIGEGSALVIATGGRSSRVPVDPEQDIQPVAASLAQFDVAAAPHGKNPRETYENLKNLHAKVLASPEDEELLKLLVAAQKSYKGCDCNPSYQQRRLEKFEQQRREEALEEERSEIPAYVVPLERGYFSRWQEIPAAPAEIGAAVGIVCSNRTFRRVQEAGWRPTKRNCSNGALLTEAEYASLIPAGGRFRVAPALFELQQVVELEGPHSPPFVLPQGRLATLRPTVWWLHDPQATDVRIFWQIGSNGVVYGQEAGVHCSQGNKYCSADWPRDYPDLGPGETLVLKVAEQQPAGWISSPEVRVSTPSRMELGEQVEEFQRLEKIGLSGGALLVARAGFLAKAEAYSAAADEYARAFELTGAPEALVARADMLSLLGLYDEAGRLYRDAFPKNPLGALFGLGRIAYMRGAYAEACELFGRAALAYLEQGLDEEQILARRARDLCRFHLPQ